VPCAENWPVLSMAVGTTRPRIAICRSVVLAWITQYRRGVSAWILIPEGGQREDHTIGGFSAKTTIPEGVRASILGHRRSVVLA